jgi:hypothetical protein
MRKWLPQSFFVLPNTGTRKGKFPAKFPDSIARWLLEQSAIDRQQRL